MVIERPSLTSDGLDQVWELVRQRLERQGFDNRGRVRLPELSARARRNLAAVVGAPVRATVDLHRVEEGLRSLGVGDDLPAALAALGFAPSDEPARRRAERRAGKGARDAARAAAAAWSEPWASDWIDEVIRAGTIRGLDEIGAVALVASVRTVLDALAARADDPDALPLSRVDLAARLLGSAHGLDRGSRIEAATTRALARSLGPSDPSDLWERAGAHLDLTSGPALTWNLPVSATSGLAPLLRAAAELAVPVHLTQFALRRHPLTVPPGTDVLVVENPRIVEAAAQTRSPLPVIAAYGNPSAAVRLLLRQLVAAGASIRYHGDFDAAGLAMCARMHAFGLAPWRMSSADYLDALTEAHAAGVELPHDPAPVGPTPWEPALATLFASRRLVVHEERLLPSLLLSPR